MLPFPFLQGVDLSSCGNSSWNFSPTNPASTSSAGRATAGSSSSPTPTRWPADGARERTNPKWTTKNSAADWDITTIKTLFTKRQENAMCTDLFVTCKAFWDTRPRSFSRRATSHHRKTRTTSEVLVRSRWRWIHLENQVRTHYVCALANLAWPFYERRCDSSRVTGRNGFYWWLMKAVGWWNGQDLTDGTMNETTIWLRPQVPCIVDKFAAETVKTF